VRKRDKRKITEVYMGKIVRVDLIKEGLRVFKNSSNIAVFKERRQKMKKGLLLFGTVALVVGFFFGYVATSSGEEPVRIGLVTPVTWDIGKTQIAAAELAVEEVNRVGGILGRPVKLFVADSELKAAGASTAVHKLVKADGCDFLVGIYGSEEGLGAREAACDLKKIAVFSSGATHDWITTTLQNYERYKYTFRNGSFDEVDAQARYVIDEQVPFMAEIVKKELGIKKVRLAILTDAAKWTDSSTGLFLKEFPEKGYEIVYNSRFSTTATDASVELTGIKKSGAHIIVGCQAYKSALPLIRQWYEMRVPAIWAGINTFAITSKFWEQTGSKCAYMSTYNFGTVHVPITPQTKMMYDYLMKKIGIYWPPSHGPYVSIWSLKHAAEKAKTLETEAMIKALLEIKFDSVGGTVKYMPNHSHLWGPPGIGSQMWTLQHHPENKLVMVHIGPLKSDQRLADYVDGKLLLPPWMIEAWKK
jgi:branched-chain amino acid transport system substrate-binding protein